MSASIGIGCFLAPVLATVAGFVAGSVLLLCPWLVTASRVGAYSLVPISVAL